MLLVWSAVEEALRVLASRFAPNESGRKILTPDQAYSIGLISQNQHRALNYARELRNQVAHNIGSISIPDYVSRDTAGLLERMVKPSYVPPPIMADRVLSQILPDQEVLEQVNNLFPDADQVEQVDAAEYIASLRSSSEE